MSDQLLCLQKNENNSQEICKRSCRKIKSWKSAGDPAGNLKIKKSRKFKINSINLIKKFGKKGLRQAYIFN
jgi:hypothetical protein